MLSVYYIRCSISKKERKNKIPKVTPSLAIIVLGAGLDKKRQTQSLEEDEVVDD